MTVTGISVISRLQLRVKTPMPNFTRKFSSSITCENEHRVSEDSDVDSNSDSEEAVQRNFVHK